MANNLRKVIYSLVKPQYYYDAPDLQRENDELSREREGYFHRWIENVDTSGDIPCIKPWALIEDAETGKLEETQYFLITFIDKPQ